MLERSDREPYIVYTVMGHNAIKSPVWAEFVYHLATFLPTMALDATNADRSPDVLRRTKGNFRNDENASGYTCGKASDETAVADGTCR